MIQFTHSDRDINIGNKRKRQCTESYALKHGPCAKLYALETLAFIKAHAPVHAIGNVNLKNTCFFECASAKALKRR